MERKILIASTNTKKAAEMLAILRSAVPDTEFITLADFPEAPEVDECGETFIENARIKALAGFALAGVTTIADDGGLCLYALDGMPGVKSHRYLGENTSFPDKMAHILDSMQSVQPENRTCRFQCAVVVAFPDGRTFECMGSCEGVIGKSMTGAGGFGYDPIFFLPELYRYMAELTPEEKQQISHRGKALALVADVLHHAFTP